MTYVYKILTGELYKDGIPFAVGYSGTGLGRNNPDKESIPNIGPIPIGKYTIGPAYTHPVEGPLVMNLTPSEDTNTFGRTGFHIHGDNTEHDASHGCIILWRPIRQMIADNPDKALEVTI